MKSTQMKVSKQSLMVDQNYTNNCLFVALSTLESIYQMDLKNIQNCRSQSKIFGQYDEFDYSRKSKEQLKAQLQTQILCLQLAKDIFEKQYKDEGFVWPSNFSLQKFQQIMERFRNHYNKLKNDDTIEIIEMIDDIKSIMTSECSNNLNVEDKEYGTDCSQVNKQNFVSGVFHSKKVIQREKQKIQNLTLNSQSQLKAKIQFPEGLIYTEQRLINHQKTNPRQNQKNFFNIFKEYSNCEKFIKFYQTYQHQFQTIILIFLNAAQILSIHKSKRQTTFKEIKPKKKLHEKYFQQLIQYLHHQKTNKKVIQQIQVFLDGFYFLPQQLQIYISIPCEFRQKFFKVLEN